MTPGPGELREITVIVLLHGAVCVAVGAMFGMALGPSIADGLLSSFRRMGGSGFSKCGGRPQRHNEGRTAMGSRDKGNSDGKTSTDGDRPQGGSRSSDEKTDGNPNDGQKK